MEVPRLDGDVLTWATDLDEKTIEQAQRTARLDFVHKPLALMADAHLGLGATIGSVVATEGAIIPAAVGVDIGCGMIAQSTSLRAPDIDDKLDAIHDAITKAVPAGQPRKGDRKAGSHGEPVDSATLDRLIQTRPDVDDQRFTSAKIASQFGTLGGGNHFIELAVDETDRVWIVLHSGSRGPGNIFAQLHIGKARSQLIRVLESPLEDPDLAHLVQATPEFEAYITGMLWAQDFALENRAQMMKAVLASVVEVWSGQCNPTQSIAEGDQIQCHHNYAALETHHGKEMWVTRKGAIDASLGNKGIIPGSMATGSYIVTGLGNAESYRSASHGAGRRLSRRAARRELSAESLHEAMAGISWNDDPEALLDEHPDAYKDLEMVMDNQKELVKVEHRLNTILNYKGA